MAGRINETTSKPAFAVAVPRGGRLRSPAMLAPEPSSADFGPWREFLNRLQDPNGGIRMFCEVS